MVIFDTRRRPKDTDNKHGMMNEWGGFHFFRVWYYSAGTYGLAKSKTIVSHHVHTEMANGEYLGSNEDSDGTRVMKGRTIVEMKYVLVGVLEKQQKIHHHFCKLGARHTPLLNGLQHFIIYRCFMGDIQRNHIHRETTFENNVACLWIDLGAGK